MIDTVPVTRAFEKIGANVQIREIARRRWSIRPTSQFTIDVRPVDGKETFLVDIPKDIADKVAVSIIDSQPKLRHLLLQVRTNPESRNRTVDNYLCGHDERHWFVSAVKAKNVKEAFDVLKPTAVHLHEKRVGLKRSRKNKHRNEAWTRQGEWFFVPAPDFDPGKNPIIHKNEPISRGNGSKSHMCEELIRRGGQVVFVSSKHPNGLTQKQYDEWKATASSTDVQVYRFQQRVADAEVYVRGWIRHPDHKTIRLNTWHRVQINGELVSKNVRFLD